MIADGAGSGLDAVVGPFPWLPAFAGAAAGAAVLAFGTPRALAGTRTGRGTGSRTWPGSSGTSSTGPASRAAAVALLAIALFVLADRPGLCATAVAVVAGSWGWQVRRGRRRAAEQRVSDVVALTAAWAAALRTGVPVVRALDLAGRRAQGDVAESVRRACAVAELGGDPAVVLRGAAALPGAGGLRAVASLLQLAADRGAAVSPAIGRVNEALAAAQRHDRQVGAEAAAAVSGAKVLVTLPGIGLLLGWALGARPLAFLLGGPRGWVCLSVGCALQLAGLAWVGLLLRGARQTGG